MKKRISLPFLAAVVVVLIAVIVIVKPFPQKASAVFPEKLLELSCTVARESVDGERVGNRSSSTAGNL